MSCQLVDSYSRVTVRVVIAPPTDCPNFDCPNLSTPEGRRVLANAIINQSIQPDWAEKLYGQLQIDNHIWRDLWQLKHELLEPALEALMTPGPGRVNTFLTIVRLSKRWSISTGEQQSSMTDKDTIKHRINTKLPSARFQSDQTDVTFQSNQSTKLQVLQQLRVDLAVSLAYQRQLEQTLSQIHAASQQKRSQLEQLARNMGHKFNDVTKLEV